MRETEAMRVRDSRVHYKHEMQAFVVLHITITHVHVAFSDRAVSSCMPTIHMESLFSFAYVYFYTESNTPRLVTTIFLIIPYPTLACGWLLLKLLLLGEDHCLPPPFPRNV